MTDNAPAPTVETPDDPETSKPARRIGCLAAAIMAIAIVVLYSIPPKPRPLSATESRLVGSWIELDGGRVNHRWTFYPNHTSLHVTDPSTFAQEWHYHWKIDGGDLIVTEQRRNWHDYANAILNGTIFSPDGSVIPVTFVTNDEMLWYRSGVLRKE